MTPFKHIVFDFDGTLLDSRASFLSMYNEIAQKRGYLSMTPGNLVQLRDMSIPERCTFLKVPIYRLPFLVAEALKKYKSILPGLKFNQGIRELLEELSGRGMQYAILSSNSKSNITGFFLLQGIVVDDLYTSGKIFGKDKMLKKFLKDKQLTASDILYVGDEARDIIACKKAGVKVAWVSWGYDALGAVETHAPDYVINTPSELRDVILQGE